MMIPSDHFVLFYNEMFKFLEENGSNELQKYYGEVSRHQEIHCLELFKAKGLQGMYEYWEHIRIEENCDLELVLEPGHFCLVMNKCPSLSKILDSDGGPSASYCKHCPGWIGPVIKKAGFYTVYDLFSLTIPQCRIHIFEKLEDAEKFREEMIAKYPGHPELVQCNFQV